MFALLWKQAYDVESNKIKTCLEKTTTVTYKEVLEMIHNEVPNWKRYDEWFNLRIQSEGANAEQKQQQQRPKKTKRVSRKTKRRLSFPGPKKKKSKSDSDVGPKVRVVTALDHANDAQEETNANIVKTMAAQKVL